MPLSTTSGERVAADWLTDWLTCTNFSIESARTAAASSSVTDAMAFLPLPSGSAAHNVHRKQTYDMAARSVPPPPSGVCGSRCGL